MNLFLVYLFIYLFCLYFINITWDSWAVCTNEFVSSTFYIHLLFLFYFIELLVIICCGVQKETTLIF